VPRIIEFACEYSKEFKNMKLKMKNKQHDGYFIYGSYQTVAWYKTKEEADYMCRKMNYGMEFGYYKVVPSYK